MRCTCARNVMLLVGIIAASCFSPLIGAQSKNGQAMRSKEAEALHTKGREAGASGDYAEALALLTKAAMLAPDWPYPVYDRAFTRLLMEDFDGALADYEKTLKLSPRGFFKAHVAVDTLRREQQGEFPRGFYLAYATLEQMEESQRRDILGQLVEKVPGFAPAWLDYAKFGETPEERLRRIERGLAAKPDAETYGMLKLNQAFVLQQLGQSAAAEATFRDLASNPKSTAAVEALAKVWLTKK
jgi:tetratricopeptide (TPR) repeat protein